MAIDEEFDFDDDFDDEFEIEEEEYFPILDNNKLTELNAKEIHELFFRKDVFYSDVTLYVRIKRQTEYRRYYDIYMFKLIQPFGCRFYMIANSLDGNKWDSLELSGDYSEIKEQSLKFIREYLKKYITHKKGEIKIEVDVSTFENEIRFMPGCEVPIEMQ